MNEAEAQEPILSREELDALLESLRSDAGAPREGSSSSSSASARVRAVQSGLTRSMDLFADDWSRHLSNVHQMRIHLTMISCRATTREEFAELLRPADRVVCFDTEPQGGRGFLLLGRPLLFSLLTLNLGAGTSARRSAIPTRSYTRIELRLLRIFAQEILAELDRSLEELVTLRSNLTALADRETVREVEAERVFAITFDVRGFGEICRLRVAYPISLFMGEEEAATPSTAHSRSDIGSVVLEMRVPIQAELGSITLPLRKLADLEIGQVLPVDAPEGGELLVRVGDSPKFRAIRGHVGSRMAVQLTERV